MKEISRIQTGILGLDDILHGGLPSGQMYLLEGDPGTGKTTVALQFVLEGRRIGERCLYVTLSESKGELEAAARSHGWSLDGIPIEEFVPEEASLSPESQYTVFHPSEVELASTVTKLLEQIELVNPERLVLDSLSEFRLLAADQVRYRRQLLALKQFLAGRNTTTLLLDDRTGEGNDMQLQSIAHGVLRLEKQPRSYGVTRRRIEVLKIRGAAYREGYHDYNIAESGFHIYPRLVAAEHSTDATLEQLSSGVPGLDALFGGGVERGSSTLVLGPSGVGKSSIVMQYATTCAARGERAVLYTFDESVRTAKLRARSLGMSVDAQIEKGMLHLKQVDPAELSPGEFVWDLRREVDERHAQVVIIDSLNGFLHSMPGETDLPLVLHELLTFLGQKAVATFLVLTQHGLLGATHANLDVSYLADSILMMRHFEADATILRALSVLKKRGGMHENTVREFRLSSAGIEVLAPMRGFQGILSETHVPLQNNPHARDAKDAKPR